MSSPHHQQARKYVTFFFILSFFVTPKFALEIDAQMTISEESYVQSIWPHVKNMLESHKKYSEKAHYSNVLFDASAPTRLCHPCEQEWKHCNEEIPNGFGNYIFNKIPEYRDCAEAFWKYVEEDRWDLTHKMIQIGKFVPYTPKNRDDRPNSKPEMVEESSANTNPSRQQTSNQGSSNRRGYTDIDDLSTEDIEIPKPSEAKPTTSNSSSQSYCPCKGGDKELLGLCWNPAIGEVYMKGQFPMTKDCYINPKGKE